MGGLHGINKGEGRRTDDTGSCCGIGDYADIDILGGLYLYERIVAKIVGMDTIA